MSPASHKFHLDHTYFFGVDLLSFKSNHPYAGPHLHACVADPSLDDIRSIVVLKGGTLDTN
jgi:hypothetical protein